MRPPRRLFLFVPALLLAALSALPTSAEPAAVRSNKGPAGPAVTAEAAHYRIVTLPVPECPWPSLIVYVNFSVPWKFAAEV